MTSPSATATADEPLCRRSYQLNDSKSIPAGLVASPTSLALKGTTPTGVTSSDGTIRQKVIQGAPAPWRPHRPFPYALAAREMSVIAGE
jgi:hypothetical protein